MSSQIMIFKFLAETRSRGNTDVLFPVLWRGVGGGPSDAERGGQGVGGLEPGDGVELRGDVGGAGAQWAL